MISGREAIKKFWSDLITSSDATSAPLDSVEVTPTGDGMVEIGHATIDFKALPPSTASTLCFGAKRAAFGSGTSISGTGIADV